MKISEKILLIGVVFLLTQVSFIPIISSISVDKNIEKKEIPEIVIEKEIFDNNLLTTNCLDVHTQTYPKDSSTPISVYGTQLYGKEWDYDREMWRYRYRFDWYQAKRGEAFGDSGWDEWPYVVLQVDLSIQASGIVSGSGNDFAHGGWNVERHNSGDFEDIGQVICGAVLACFPGWFGLSFGTGLSLARALKDTSPTSLYTWQGTQVKEGNGFFQYDCYIKPNTEWQVKFYLDFWGSSVDREYQDYRLLWRWYGTSPGEGPGKIEITPSSYNFGSIDVDTSKDKTFKIKNVGGQTAHVEVDVTGSEFSKVSGIISGGIKSGETEEVVVRFRPRSSGSKSGTLKVECEDCQKDASAGLSGTGNKARERSKYELISTRKALIIFLNNLGIFR